MSAEKYLQELRGALRYEGTCLHGIVQAVLNNSGRRDHVDDAGWLQRGVEELAVALESGNCSRAGEAHTHMLTLESRT
jgi:hypothetical protein